MRYCVAWNRGKVSALLVIEAKRRDTREAGDGAKESVMFKQTTLLRGVALAVMFALLSLPSLSVAQAGPQADAATHPKKHVARMHHPMQRESAASRTVYHVAPNGPDCTWPYTRMLPPCMSTWPAGDPNYHGTLRGNQFE